MIKRYYNAIGAAVGGTPNTHYGVDTSESGSPTYEQHTANLVGVAGDTLTLQVTTYANSNHTGRLLINGGLRVLNDTFTVVLDGSGNGSYTIRVDGDAGQLGSGIFANVSIIGMITGFPSSPISNSISKAF